jgi:peptidoglycan/LPS O-acetylase OafA/YrhL
VELQFYILLPVLVLSFRRIRLEYRILLLFLISLAFNAFLSGFQGEKETTLSKLAGVSLLPYLYCFLTGALLYLFREKLRFILEGKALYWLLIFGLYCYFSGESPSYFPGIVQMPANLLLSFLTISFAYTAPGMGRILHGNDISYGLYIYHMPIVNTLLSLGLFGSPQHLLLAFGLTTGMGLLSWLLVEKKALELKRHFTA